jgi:uncharacterized membrane-anchored protein
MAIAVLAVRHWLPGELDVRVKLVSEITVGTLVYALAMLTLHRERIRAAIAPIVGKRSR